MTHTLSALGASGLLASTARAGSDGDGASLSTSPGGSCCCDSSDAARRMSSGGLPRRRAYERLQTPETGSP